MNYGLEKFDEVFTPNDSGRPTGVESLADGEYTFAVVTAELSQVTTKAGETIPVLRWLYKASQEAGPARSVEVTTWMRDARSVNALGADLMLLGLPCHEWTAAKGKPFSSMLPEAVEGLPGVVFRAEKFTTDKAGRTYHNLKILGVVRTTSMPLDKLPF